MFTLQPLPKNLYERSSFTQVMFPDFVSRRRGIRPTGALSQRPLIKARVPLPRRVRAVRRVPRVRPEDGGERREKIESHVAARAPYIKSQTGLLAAVIQEEKDAL